MTCEAKMLWRPIEERAKRTQMYAFMRRASEKYGFAADYTALHRWSVTRRDQFWGEMLEFAGIRASKATTAVESGKGMLGTKWFAGMDFNFAEHLLRFDDDRIAIEAEDELGRTRSITYRELRGEVAALAAGLRAMGVGRGEGGGGGGGAVGGGGGLGGRGFSAEHCGDGDRHAGDGERRGGFLVVLAGFRDQRGV